MDVLIILSFIAPFVMLLVGNLLKKHPVTDMDRHQGYNTPSSRKSQAHWDYAQSIAPGIFITYGKTAFIIILIIDVVLYLLPINIDTVVSSGIGIGLIFVFIAFFTVEKQIGEKFPD